MGYDNRARERRDEKAAAGDVLLRMALISYCAGGGTREEAQALCEAVDRAIQQAMPVRELASD